MVMAGHVASKTASIAGVALLVIVTPGCSFVFTRGPQPSLPGPPSTEPSKPVAAECTSSVAAPVTDTVLSTLSVAILVGGVAALATPEPPCTSFCFRGFNQGVGWTGIIVGGITSAIFIASAVTGYQRTADCRASLEAGARLPPPRASVPPSIPDEVCRAAEDVPRACTSIPSWWTSGLAESSLDLR
jgi:hypothetical protein